jgi:hypothetical protein
MPLFSTLQNDETDKSKFAVEAGDLITMDYNARPTLVPRVSAIAVGVITYLFLAYLLPIALTGSSAPEMFNVVVSLLAGWAYSKSCNSLLPNQIRITDNGIALGWSNLFFSQVTTPCIPWTSIDGATFLPGTAFEDSLEGCLLLTVTERPQAAIFECPYQALSEKFWKAKETSSDHHLRILVSGIAHKSDREFFAQQLVRHLPINSVHRDALRALDSRYPLPIVHGNAFKTTITFFDDVKAIPVARIRSDAENPANVADLCEFVPRMARLLPRSIMEQKLRDSLGLKPDEILDDQIGPRADSCAATSITLDYKPLRLLRPMLDAIDRSGSLTFFCVFLPLVIIGFLEISQLQTMIPFVLAVILGVPVMLGLTKFFIPSLMTLSDAGISLDWRKGEAEIPGPKIAWNDITYVSFSKPENSWQINSTINFHIQPDCVSPMMRLLLFTFFHPLSSSGRQLRLTLIESGLLYGTQTHRFYEGLARNLPPERIDPLLLERFCPRSESSFTTLWLSSLTKERVRTEPLKEGDLVGDGRYKVNRQIGAGGQGIAYEAVSIEGGNESTERVVLKEFIIPSHAGQSAQAKTLESVHRESELLQSIDHPFVVKMKDSFIEDHRFYLVMEHAEGSSLRKLVNESGPLSSRQVEELAVHLLSILSHLHMKTPAIIHRDFTPENVIINSDGMPKLIDFNVARQSESTATRTVVGKHSYLPPEQFRGKACPQSDIYALGATLFFALTGVDPEPISASRPSEKNNSVCSKLDEIVWRATQLNTDQRYQSAQQMREDLLRPQAISA